jgi:uncharacterized protein (TIGR00290 family)
MPSSPRQVLLAWSGGKDSAWALHRLRAAQVPVAGLFTTVHEDTARVAIHAVRTTLLEKQADAAGLALHQLPIPHDCPNETYERVLSDFARRVKAQGVTHLAFGDLFLEEIRRYRERQFAASGLGLLFPLWGLPTRPLAEEMTQGGLRAWITCVDTTQAPAAWAGRFFDREFVREVPPAIDPCGENGEFHTFVFEGPMLRCRVETRLGNIRREGRWAYADVVAVEDSGVSAQ